MEWERLPPRSEQSVDTLALAEEQPSLERRRYDPMRPPDGQEEPMLMYVARSALQVRAAEAQMGQPLRDQTLQLYGDPAGCEAVMLMASRHLAREVESVQSMEVARQLADEMRREKRQRREAPAPSASAAASSSLSAGTTGIPATPSGPSIVVRQHSTKTRYISADGILGSQKKPTQGGRAAWDPRNPPAESLADFFRHDEFAADRRLPSLIADLRLQPGYAELQANYERDQIQYYHRMEMDVEQVPRPASFPSCTRTFLFEFYLPPRRGQRLCRNEYNCRFLRDRQQGSKRGYIGREFHPVRGWQPDPKNNPEMHRRTCVLCDRWETQWRMEQHMKTRTRIDQWLNAYTIPVSNLVGYTAWGLLPTELNRIPTGIYGHFQGYNEERLDFRPISDDVMQRYGLDADGPRFFKMDVGLDF